MNDYDALYKQLLLELLDEYEWLTKEAEQDLISYDVKLSELEEQSVEFQFTLRSLFARYTIYSTAYVNIKTILDTVENVKLGYDVYTHIDELGVPVLLSIPQLEQ
jgi:hypothetical protein